MALFRFRLETALKLRRHAEEESKKLLAQRIRALESKQQEMLSLRQQLTDAVQERRQLLEQREFRSELMVYGLGWMEGLKAQMETCQTAIAEAEQQVTAARAALVVSRRGVKILEILRERRYQQWRIMENRRQERTSSDLAGIRWQAQHASLSDS